MMSDNDFVLKWNKISQTIFKSASGFVQNEIWG